MFDKKSRVWYSCGRRIETQEEEIMNKLSQTELHLRAFKENMPLLLDYLEQSSKNIINADISPEKYFIKISTLHIKAFIQMYIFMIGRHENMVERCPHIQAGNRSASLFVVNIEQIDSLSALFCLVRQDVVWVYGTALVRFFLEEILYGNITLEKESFSVASLEDILSRLPENWIPRINEMNDATKVMSVAFKLSNKTKH